MFDYRTIDINYFNISRDRENEGKVIEVKPVYEYIDNKPSDKVIGTKYTLILEKNKYQTIDIKVEEKKPCITQDDIEKNDGYIPVVINGFKASLYQNKDKNIFVSAKAESIEVIK